MKNNQRLIIVSKDVERITGLKPQACRKILRIIKELNGKSSHQAVTIDEFCAYKGLKVEQVQALLK
jgi:Mg2+/Co2+ transporter CorC